MARHSRTLLRAKPIRSTCRRRSRTRHHARIAVTVGHSYGSVIAWAEARHGDIDAIVATDAAHSVSAPDLAPVASGLV